MKSSINIAKCLRVIFGVVQILIVFLATVTAVWLLVPAKADHPRYITIISPKLTFDLNNDACTVQTASSASNDIKIGELNATLKINRNSTDAQLRTRVRWLMIPSIFYSLAYWFMLSRCLKKLCRNIECGEIFSDLNLRLVSSIGFLLVIAGVISNALVFLGHHFLGNYLMQHATTNGLNVSLKSDLIKNLDLYGLIIGLFVLLIAEAFRQGLALKKENELTV